MKKILFIGAGFLQDFIIQKAAAMGYKTLALDADQNAVGFSHADHFEVIDIIDEQACLAYARREGIDGVITAATDYGVLSAAYIAEQMGLPGLRYETAKLIKNKYHVRRCLHDHHVDDTMQFCEIDASADIDSIAAELRYPVMVKPCDGSGSRGAGRANNSLELKTICEYAINSSVTKCAEVESFITGSEYGVESIIVDSEIHILSIMKKWMTNPPYYAELGHAIPCGLSPEKEQKVRKCAYNAIKALGINFGAVNMDLLITEDGSIHIVDAGARMGGNMIGPCIITYGTGIDYMGAIIRSAAGDPVDWSEGEKSAVVSRLLAFEKGIVKTIPDMEAIEKQYDVEIYHHMKGGMFVNEYHTNLDGCGYVIAKGKTVEDAQSRAELALQAIVKESF